MPGQHSFGDTTPEKIAGIESAWIERVERLETLHKDVHGLKSQIGKLRVQLNEIASADLLNRQHIRACALRIYQSLGTDTLRESLLHLLLGAQTADRLIHKFDFKYGADKLKREFDSVMDGE